MSFRRRGSVIYEIVHPVEASSNNRKQKHDECIYIPHTPDWVKSDLGFVLFRFCFVSVLSA